MLTQKHNHRPLNGMGGGKLMLGEDREGRLAGEPQAAAVPGSGVPTRPGEPQPPQSPKQRAHADLFVGFLCGKVGPVPRCPVVPFFPFVF